jgi:hypothetical protein
MPDSPHALQAREQWPRTRLETRDCCNMAVSLHCYKWENTSNKIVFRCQKSNLGWGPGVQVDSKKSGRLRHSCFSATRPRGLSAKSLYFGISCFPGCMQQVIILCHGYHWLNPRFNRWNDHVSETDRGVVFGKSHGLSLDFVSGTMIELKTFHIQHLSPGYHFPSLFPASFHPVASEREIQFWITIRESL